jgi:predicted flap endonuclease-1-like 5' DNA nuclease
MPANPEQKLLKAVLAELKAAKGEIASLGKSQKKTARQVHALKNKIAKMKPCKCRVKKKSGKKKKASKLEPVSATHPASGFNGVIAPNLLENPAPLSTVLDAPKAGIADDLKLIAGVGPKLEETLNGLGVYHFDQIAAWTQNEIDWVDDYLKFSGRIERDNWIEQAKALAKGGWDEYVKVFGREPR